VVSFHNLFDNRKPQTRPGRQVMRFRGPIESLKNSFAVKRCDYGAFAPYREDYLRALHHDRRVDRDPGWEYLLALSTSWTSVVRISERSANMGTSSPTTET
jgi:hypothetical protein